MQSEGTKDTKKPVRKNIFYHEPFDRAWRELKAAVCEEIRPLVRAIQKMLRAGGG